MKILSEETFSYGEIKFKKLRIESPIDLPNKDGCVLGYDPGTTKMGASILWRTYVATFEISMPRNPNPVDRILLTQEALSECLKPFIPHALLTIEGSSFGNTYRQVELAEVRASAVLWAINYGIVPSIIPPTTIRKVVFGNGKLKAEEQWKELPPNAASSLACAIYPLLK